MSGTGGMWSKIRPRMQHRYVPEKNLVTETKGDDGTVTGDSSSSSSAGSALVTMAASAAAAPGASSTTYAAKKRVAEIRTAAFSANPVKRVKQVEEKHELEDKVAEAAEGPASMIVQFQAMNGTTAGPQIDVSMDTTPAQMEVIINELLQNDEAVPYAFYVDEEEIMEDLRALIKSQVKRWWGTQAVCVHAGVQGWGEGFGVRRRVCVTEISREKRGSFHRALLCRRCVAFLSWIFFLTCCPASHLLVPYSQ